MSAVAVPREHILYEEDLPGGCHWSIVINRGWTLRLTDLEGGANVAALLVNKDDKAERYCMPDTLKAQHTAVLTAGFVCYSDMGRILMSISADTCGGHDTLCGTTNASLINEKFGERSYQDARNEYHRNGRDSLLIELGRWGLDRRDLVPNINFFSRVTVDNDGRTQLLAAHSKPGSYVDLRAEMNVLVLLSATPHPFHPGSEYPRKPVRMTVWKSGVAGPDDVCRTSRPENERGFRNTEALFAHESFAGLDGSDTPGGKSPAHVVAFKPRGIGDPA